MNPLMTIIKNKQTNKKLTPRDQMVSRSWAEASCSLGIVLLLVVPKGAPASSWNTRGKSSSINDAIYSIATLNAIFQFSKVKSSSATGAVADKDLTLENYDLDD